MSMVEIQVEYQGALRCRAVHGPSGVELWTDAPVDNHGKGESFSPTDLVATSSGTCMLTIMGIAAAKHGWDLKGATATVVKHMLAEPVRRIGKLEVVLKVPGEFDERARTTLERAAMTCPVHATLGAAGVELPVRFEWSGVALT
jgi:putative redox protein